MISEDDWSRLARLAAGECTPEEAEAIARWSDACPERREALEFIREMNVAARVSRPQWDTDASWDRGMARWGARLQSRFPLRLTPVVPRRRILGGPRWVAAAVLVVTAGVLAGGWQLWRTTEARRSAAAIAAAGPMRERATARGERAMFQLPDGSLVILAAASRVRYPASFQATSGRRDVYLEGQAFFEVKHNERRPFLVHTATGVAEDMGTRFTVQEYPGDTALQVVVAEGSVELRATAHSSTGVLLQRGQFGQLSRKGEAIVRFDVDLAQLLAWTEGRLVFDDTPLRDVLPQLSRWYDLEFLLADSVIGAKPLTASLAGENVVETLELLSSTLDIRYERHGRTVTFLPRRPIR